jgi:hypothetical protein
MRSSSLCRSVSDVAVPLAKQEKYTEQPLKNLLAIFLWAEKVGSCFRAGVEVGRPGEGVGGVSGPQCRNGVMEGVGGVTGVR